MKVQIYGERCSGTNFLEQVILLNFKTEITWEYGFKHFFGFNEYDNSDDTLFISIIRDPVDWLNSFFRNPHQLHYSCCKDIKCFLYNTIGSFKHNSPRFRMGRINQGPEKMTDRNMYTKQRYKNIFELRYTKLKYMRETLPTKVKNHIFIKYEDLRDDFENTMNKIRDMGLEIKNEQKYPIPLNKPAKNYQTMGKKHNIIPKHIILNHPNFNTTIEKDLGYNIQ